MEKANCFDLQLWEKMERAFDSRIIDGAYSFNEVASAMLGCIASNLEQTISAGGTVEDVTEWLRMEALAALRHFEDDNGSLPF